MRSLFSPLLSASIPWSASSPRCWAIQNWPAARPAVGPVEAVVGDPRADHVLRIHGAAEELDAVVLVEVHLDVIHFGAAADTLEGDPVQLVVGAELGAGELHAHVVEDAAAVGGVVAAVGAGVALAFALAAGDVQRGVAVDDEAAPVAAGPLALRLVARHHDRSLSGPHGHQRATAGHDQGAVRGAVAVDPRAGFDGQGHPVVHEYRAPEDDFGRGDPGRVFGDLSFHLHVCGWFRRRRRGGRRRSRRGRRGGAGSSIVTGGEADQGRCQEDGRKGELSAHEGSLLPICECVRARAPAVSFLPNGHGVLLNGAVSGPRTKRSARTNVPG